MAGHTNDKSTKCRRNVKKELQEQLLNLKLDVSGEGDKVVKQSPAAGTKVKEGETVRIYMGK